MDTIIEVLRKYVGVPDFYVESGTYNSTWDYGAMLEYCFACLLLLIVVGSVFRIIVRMFNK